MCASPLCQHKRIRPRRFELQGVEKVTVYNDTDP
ncbi:uncharacterized protein ANIA_11494 [Aspergillus nidulans FGSC A4]|uniref:Uncharacterized protein n=1 Tax=Emericella nidulans (strain FGSC A4 / ATCC 38163 / CBS 112.46 / NRRL 194 / M139) TaxID=227321 RepID=C8V3J9_EMENI|nr:hypothetical protein [Aspergillus nidulans FGSC A4]CBF70559.1 TPA: hypothetical protein ANIA_11494 [Aspergillus nidulans FGSC A4]